MKLPAYKNTHVTKLLSIRHHKPPGAHPEKCAHRVELKHLSLSHLASTCPRRAVLTKHVYSIELLPFGNILPK